MRVRKADADAEARRLADAADAKRKADAEAEAKRLADAADAKRKADAEAEAKRLAEAADAKRKADAEAAALAKAKADEERRIALDAEAKQMAAIAAAEAEAKRIADAARTTVITRTPAPDVPAPAAPSAPAPAANPPAPVVTLGTTASATPATAACDADAVSAIETTRLTFDTASSRIGAPDQSEIERLSVLLKRCATLSVTISGHTDDVGAEGYNAALSQQRAEVIRSELQGQGIAPDRLNIRWFGGTRPLAPNITDAGRAMNRRVELTLGSGLDVTAPANAARVAACRTEFSRILTQGAIVFEPSSAVLAAVSSAKLDEVAAMAKSCAAFGLLVEGHADKTGNPTWNIQLSGLRAKAVREALIARGVPAARLDAKGFGSSRLLDTSDTQDAHAKNRRIEISIGAPAARTN